MPFRHPTFAYCRTHPGSKPAPDLIGVRVGFFGITLYSIFARSPSNPICV
jgi:hypothetical protein